MKIKAENDNLFTGRHSLSVITRIVMTIELIILFTVICIIIYISYLILKTNILGFLLMKMKLKKLTLYKCNFYLLFYSLPNFCIQ